MNKLFSKIAVLSVGLAMALGVGIAVSQKAPVRAKATEDTATYSLVTSVEDLEVDKNYVITNGKDAGSVKAMSTASQQKYRQYTAVTVDAGGTSLTATAATLRLTLSGSSGSWIFTTDNYQGTNGRLYPASGKDNYLYVGTSSSTATISFSSDKAIITLSGNSSGRSVIQWNNSSGQERFSCYTSNSQSPVYLWKEATSSTPSIQLSETTVSLLVDNESGVTVTATPKNFEGTVVYSWSTTSESILLENTSTATVTIKPNTIVPGSATVSLSAYDDVSVPSSEPIVKQVTVNLVNYAGVYALSSKTTTYTSEVDNEKFHNLVNNSEAFTLVSATNFRLGGSPNTTDMMLYGVSSTTLSVPAGYLIKTVVVNGYASETGGSTLSVGGVAKAVAQGAPYVDYSYYVFGQSVTITTTSRVWAKTITITVEKYVDVTVATDFEAAFLDMTAAECSAQKVTSSNWGDIKTVFGHISSDFAASAAIVKGHDESVAAIARYKYIIEKYGYEDFLNKGYVQLKNHSEYSALSNSSILTIVVITSALSAAAFTLVLVLRKKKHN